MRMHLKYLPNINPVLELLNISREFPILKTKVFSEDKIAQMFYEVVTSTSIE